MRNRIFLIGSIALSLLTACSNDEDIAGGGIAVTPGNSDVKIQLSSGQGGTRAPLNPDENGSFATDRLGIFCLAHTTATGATQKADIKWGLPDDEIYRYSTWMANVNSEAQIDATNNCTNIIFKDASGNPKEYYYPLANWYAYHFYGYFPRQEEVTYDNDNKMLIKVNIPINGKDDIIWGEATSDETDAYCAKYFRTSGNESKTPELTFKHKLMQIQFRCKPGLNSDGSVDEEAKKLFIKSIAVGGVPEEGILIIANKGKPSSMIADDLNSTGSFYCSGNTNAIDIPVYGANDNDFEPVIVGNDTDNPKTVGQGLLLPVLGGRNYKTASYTVKLLLAKDTNNNGMYDEGVDEDLEIYPSITLNKNGNILGEEGKRYFVDLIIHSPKEIKLKAKLNEWEDEATSTEIDY